MLDKSPCVLMVFQPGHAVAVPSPHCLSHHTNPHPTASLCAVPRPAMLDKSPHVPMVFHAHAITPLCCPTVQILTPPCPRRAVPTLPVPCPSHSPPRCPGVPIPPRCSPVSPPAPPPDHAPAAPPTETPPTWLITISPGPAHPLSPPASLPPPRCRSRSPALTRAVLADRVPPLPAHGPAAFARLRTRRAVRARRAAAAPPPQLGGPGVRTDAAAPPPQLLLVLRAIATAARGLHRQRGPAPWAARPRSGPAQPPPPQPPPPARLRRTAPRGGTPREAAANPHPPRRRGTGGCANGRPGLRGSGELGPPPAVGRIE